VPWGVDVIDVARIDASFTQRLGDGAGGAARFRVWLRRGIGVEAAAQPKYFRVDRRAALLGVLQFFEHQDAGAFAQDEAVALAVEGTRYLGSGPIGLAQSAQRGVGENQQRIDSAVGAAGEHEVGVVARDQAESFADRLRAGGTGGGDRAVRALSVEGKRDVCRDHVRQILQDPQGKQGAGTLLAESGGIEMTFAIAGIHEGGSQLREIDWDHAGAHDDAESAWIFAIQLDAGIANAEASRPDRETHGPRHDLHALALTRWHVRGAVEIVNLGRDLDGMRGRIKTADRPHAALAVQARRPKSVATDPVRSDDTDAGDDNSAHCPRSLCEYAPPGG